jgi:hypothetical protein
VIRHKIAEMARRVESTHALIEQVAYQMHNGIEDRQIAGPLALLKAFLATSISSFIPSWIVLRVIIVSIIAHFCRCNPRGRWNSALARHRRFLVATRTSAEV